MIKGKYMTAEDALLAVKTGDRVFIHGSAATPEYGKVDLFGKNLKQRAQALIGIAHPEHREWLEKAFYKRFKPTSSVAG